MTSKAYKRMYFCSLATFLLGATPLEAQQGLLGNLIGEKTCESKYKTSYPDPNKKNVCYYCPPTKELKKAPTKKVGLSCPHDNIIIPYCKGGPLPHYYNHNKHICIYCLSGNFNGNYDSPECLSE